MTTARFQRTAASSVQRASSRGCPAPLKPLAAAENRDEARLVDFVSADELARLHKEAETELAEPGRWGTTFTVIQSWGRRVT